MPEGTSQGVLPEGSCPEVIYNLAVNVRLTYFLKAFLISPIAPLIFFLLQLNFFFLVNIIRVLVVKLRQSQASDIEQTRKAVRAAIVLLPLLGITNLLHLVPALKTAWKFALWSYSTYFLTSFQGFFIALIYCFLNGEVSADQSALVQSRVAISLSLSFLLCRCVLYC